MSVCLLRWKVVYHYICLSFLLLRWKVVYNCSEKDYLSIHVFVCLSVHLFVFFSVTYSIIYFCIILSQSLYFCGFIFLFTCLSVRLSMDLFVCLSVHVLFVCLCVHASICLSVCQCIRYIHSWSCKRGP